jgi:hypothetical protein
MKKGVALFVTSMLTLGPVLLEGGCGFIAEPRVCEEYFDHMAPESEEACLVTWPFHLVLLAGCATVDQTVRTFECAGPAGRDACDYLCLRGNGNNIMFEHTIGLPKTLATPVVFVGSYVARWLFPLEAEDRPFEGQD